MTLGWVDHQDGTPDDVSLQSLTLARELADGGAVHALVAGPSAAGAAAALGEHGVGTVHVAAHDVFASHAPVALGRALTQLASSLGSRAVLAGGTERGNEVM